MNVTPNFDQYDAIFGDDPSTYREFLGALNDTLSKAQRGLKAAAEAEERPAAAALARVRPGCTGASQQSAALVPALVSRPLGAAPRVASLRLAAPLRLRQPTGWLAWLSYCTKHKRHYEICTGA